jgi:hypothetical protein
VSDNVSSLEITPRQADPGIVDLLEALLARAKRGEIVSMVAACEVAGGFPVLARSTDEDANYYVLTGALFELQYELKEWFDGMVTTKRTEY